MFIFLILWMLWGGVLRPVMPAVVPSPQPTNNTTLQSVVNTSSVPPKSVKEIEKEIETIIGSITKIAMPYFIRNSDLNLTASCMSTFIRIFLDLRKLKVPAIKLLDSMAKPPYGLLRGSFSVMGDYDECLEVKSDKKGDVATTLSEEYYHGQYCTVEAQFPPQILKAMQEYGSGNANHTQFGKIGNFIREFPGVNFAGNFFKFRIGICLPSTCSQHDLNEILGLVPVDFVPLGVQRCEDGAPKPLNLDQSAFLAVLTLFAVLLVSGTATDAWLHIRQTSQKVNFNDKFVRFLLSFSIYSNTQKLMKTEKHRDSEISVVNGMYVIGTILVVIYHTYFMPFFLLFSSHGSNLGSYMKDIEFTLIVTMGVSIEAYFLFSGLLLTYPRFRNNKKEVNINAIKIIVRRYIRLCPSMLLILGFIVVLPLIGSGPVFADIFDPAADNTRKWWWTYVLMFNNFLEVKDQNFLYLWFIPCLMQISIIGTILLWVLAKSAKVGIFLTVATGVACNIALGVLTYIRHYPPTYAIYYYHNREYFEETIYTAPLSHVFSYGIGMLLGYFMAKNKKLEFSTCHVVVGWIVSLFLTVGIQLVMYVGREGTDPDPTLAAFYAATHRTAFSLGLAWIILACSHGYGGALANILCWKGFGPLSKLGYFGYLVHYIVITFHVSMARTPIVYSHYENIMRICGYTVITFAVAYILYISFEVPLTFIESLFLPARQPEVETSAAALDGKQESVLTPYFSNVNSSKLKSEVSLTYHAKVTEENSKL